MNIDTNLIDQIKNLIKENKAMIREIKKVHGSIHPAVSVAEKQNQELSSSVNNYVMQVNMYNQGPIFAAAKEFAEKELVRLNTAIGVAV